MGSKRILPYIFLSVLLAIWLFSLLAVYIPTTSWGTPTFPVTMNSNMKAVFLASTVLLASTSFSMGMEKLGVFSHIAKLRGNRKKE